MKKITIGLFNDSFYPLFDGVTVVVDNYARELSKYANVIVFVPHYMGNEMDDSVFPYQVVRCYSLKVPFLDYSLPIPKLDRKFLKELDKYNLDIIHIHSPFTIGMAGVDYAKKHHIPCIATMHSQFKQDFMRAVRSEYLATKLNNRLIKIFNKCDKCLAVNAETARIFTVDYGYRGEPLVMENATDMKPLSDGKKARDYINKKHNINKNEKVFLYVGRINALKNIFFIADSLKAVKLKNPRLRFKMLYVGSGQDEEKLHEYIMKLGLDKEVIMCGKITDRYELACYYKRADLLLFPSLYDTSAIVRIEAASQEKPGLFLKGSATASMIIDNVNGFLSINTVGAYSNRILEILDNKYLYEKVCKNAYVDLYKTWEGVAKETYKIYLEMIKEKKRRIF